MEIRLEVETLFLVAIYAASSFRKEVLENPETYNEVSA